MIAIPQLVIAWLNADPGVAAATEGRISTLLQPELGFPAIVIGPVGGGPQSIPSANVDRVEKWTVPIYCLAGRRASGADDLPDNPAAWALAQIVAEAMKSLSTTPFSRMEGSLVAAQIASVTPSSDPNGTFARVLISARIDAWANA